jgi:hypothetical protein
VHRKVPPFGASREAVGAALPALDQFEAAKLAAILGGIKLTHDLGGELL